MFLSLGLFLTSQSERAKSLRHATEVFWLTHHARPQYARWRCQDTCWQCLCTCHADFRISPGWSQIGGGNLWTKWVCFFFSIKNMGNGEYGPLVCRCTFNILKGGPGVKLQKSKNGPIFWNLTGFFRNTGPFRCSLMHIGNSWNGSEAEADI